MTINSNIEAEAEAREEGSAQQPLAPTSQIANEESAAAGHAPEADEAGDLEEFTLDDIEVIESKVFA